MPPHPICAELHSFINLLYIPPCSPCFNVRDRRPVHMIDYEVRRPDGSLAPGIHTALTVSEARAQWAARGYRVIIVRRYWTRSMAGVGMQQLELAFAQRAADRQLYYARRALEEAGDVIDELYYGWNAQRRNVTV